MSMLITFSPNAAYRSRNPPTHGRTAGSARRRKACGGQSPPYADYVGPGAPGGSAATAGPFVPPCLRAYSSTWMFFFRQMSLSCFGHTVTLTSPRCALRSSSIVVRDWPIPPPIDSGIWSFRIAW